jgi:serine/threonine-protein kinase HipA
VTGELAVWLYGERVGIVDEERDRPRLTYTGEALSLYPLGTPVLSLMLPLRPERFTQGIVRPFLDGLLPEGQARLAVAEEFNLRARDTFGLIRAIGRDCAGAVVIQPADEPAPPPPSTLRAEPLSDTDIEALVAKLQTAPLGVDERVRVSLGGVQQKLLLTRMPDGSWGRPVDGTPSTHILKPAIDRFPQTVENEAFCMRVARHLGLPVAAVAMAVIGSRRLLVVERYDRIIHPGGTVDRVHQEDFCQATGTVPDNKYEEDGGPSLRRIAELLEATATPGALDDLLRAVTVNVLIGNGDAHAKNFSLLHHPSGARTLAPLYDLLCTMHYGDDHLALYIDNVQRTHRVTADRIANEATRWGLSRAHAIAVIADVVDRSSGAIAAAREDIDGVSADLVATVEGQLAQLRKTA